MEVATSSGNSSGLIGTARSLEEDSDGLAQVAEMGACKLSLIFNTDPEGVNVETNGECDAAAGVSYDGHWSPFIEPEVILRLKDVAEVILEIQEGGDGTFKYVLYVEGAPFWGEAEDGVAHPLGTTDCSLSITADHDAIEVSAEGECNDSALFGADLNGQWLIDG